MGLKTLVCIGLFYIGCSHAFFWSSQGPYRSYSKLVDDSFTFQPKNFITTKSVAPMANLSEYGDKYSNLSVEELKEIIRKINANDSEFVKKLLLEASAATSTSAQSDDTIDAADTHGASTATFKPIDETVISIEDQQPAKLSKTDIESSTSSTGSAVTPSTQTISTLTPIDASSTVYPPEINPDLDLNRQVQNRPSISTEAQTGGSNVNTNDNKQQQNNNIDNKNDDNTNDIIQSLTRLGYSRKDIVLMKNSVIKLVVESSVERPTGKLPRQWLESSNRSTARDEAMNSPDTSTTDDRATKRSERSSRNNNYSNNDRQNYANTRTVQPSRPQTTTNNNEQDDNDDDDIVFDGYPTFWPQQEEFKDLLLEESKLRLNIIGDWAAPILRQENKWRLSVYKSWLNFLDNGFGSDLNEFSTEEYGNYEETVPLKRGGAGSRSEFRWKESSQVDDALEEDIDEGTVGFDDYPSQRSPRRTYSTNSRPSNSAADIRNKRNKYYDENNIDNYGESDSNNNYFPDEADDDSMTAYGRGTSSMRANFKKPTASNLKSRSDTNKSIVESRYGNVVGASSWDVDIDEDSASSSTDSADFDDDEGYDDCGSRSSRAGGSSSASASVVNQRTKQYRVPSSNSASLRPRSSLPAKTRSSGSGSARDRALDYELYLNSQLLNNQDEWTDLRTEQQQSMRTARRSSISGDSVLPFNPDAWFANDDDEEDLVGDVIPIRGPSSSQRNSNKGSDQRKRRTQTAGRANPEDASYDITNYNSDNNNFSTDYEYNNKNDARDQELNFKKAWLRSELRLPIDNSDDDIDQVLDAGYSNRTNVFYNANYADRVGISDGDDTTQGVNM